MRHAVIVASRSNGWKADSTVPAHGNARAHGIGLLGPPCTRDGSRTRGRVAAANLPGATIDFMPDVARICMRERLRFAFIFVATCIGGCYFHEIGHAAFGWAQGISVLPTPAKEYILRAEVDWNQQAWISLGGVAATVLLVLGVILWQSGTRGSGGDAVLAGALVAPFAYTVRFSLAGRGHDGLEWQAAQSALGVNPTGHVVDVLFLCILSAGVFVWGFRRRRSMRPTLLIKAVGLAVAGLVLEDVPAVVEG